MTSLLFIAMKYSGPNAQAGYEMTLDGVLDWPWPLPQGHGQFPEASLPLSSACGVSPSAPYLRGGSLELVETMCCGGLRADEGQTPRRVTLVRKLTFLALLSSFMKWGQQHSRRRKEMVWEAVLPLLEPLFSEGVP